MSRTSKESLPGGRNAAAGSQHLRRGRGVPAGRGSRDVDESLDLFARIRRIPLISSTTESGSQSATGQFKLERMSIGSAKLGRSGADDLLSADIGETDYDWLLTPPGTPPFSSLYASEHQLSSTVPRSSSNVRSVSTTKASRLSASQSVNGQSTRPTRSGSATRASLSSTNFSSYYSNNDRTSVLNTSSASVTSRPTTPGKRPTTASTTRTNSIPASRPVPSRPSTPSKTQTSSSSSGDKPRQSQNSRPSTPTTQTRVLSTHSNSSSGAARSNSRPSTPTRRNPTPVPAPTTSNSRSSTPNRRTSMPAPAQTMARSLSVGHVPITNGRNPASRSRPSSPAPQTQVFIQPRARPNFPHEVPTNLRNKLPERPTSASKERPGIPLTVQANPNSKTPAAAAPMSSNRWQSSPIVTRGRISDNSPKSRTHSNGHLVSQPESQKDVVSETAVGRSSKPASSTDSTGFGRMFTKKSLDMALRHMDIRQGIRRASLFPQSIRPTTSKGQPGPASDPVVPTVDKAAALGDERMLELTSRDNGNHNRMISDDSNLAISEDGGGVVGSAKRESIVAGANGLDIHESSQYDAILHEHDSKDWSWLHLQSTEVQTEPRV
uniref:Flocculation protein FLO11 n=1 Tax=Elaeis guineensis var. tenera TaxID=51953 RepID=A0A6I9QK07_ELAGV|nr:flocculation protein FLO11 [Elaeis guineensis]